MPKATTRPPKRGNSTPKRGNSTIAALVEQARRELQYGAIRTQIWFFRVHGRRMSAGTIRRTFRDIGLPLLRRTKKRRPKQLTLFEKFRPGDSVQVGVKVVKIAGQKVYQYTTLDDCTRMRVLRLYRRQHQRPSLLFLSELCRAFPFPIHKLQTDNGAEFSFALSLAVREAGIRHRYIRPRCPEQNGKVERSHRIDDEEFWGRQAFADYEAAAVGLRAWARRYNDDRFSLALSGRMPAEKLAALTSIRTHLRRESSPSNPVRS